jgi:electron transport complex protein RnfA
VLGAGTTVVMLLSTLITWPINKYLLAQASYLQTLVFVCVVLVVVEVIHLLEHGVIEKFCHVDFTKFAINGAVLGLCIHNTHDDLLTAFVTALGVGIGFTVVITVFSALENRLDEDAIPNAFRGLPIHLLTAGMIALALLCF